ncbi:MAG: hypothetical protein ABID09_06505 [Candidatus Omnitrophota bacterium]
MIKLDISIALFIYLLFTVIVILALWIWAGRSSSHKGFKIGRKNIVQCTICKYVFVDPKDEDFSRCPRCESISRKADSAPQVIESKKRN